MKLFTSKSPRSAFLQSLFETLGGNYFGIDCCLLDGFDWFRITPEWNLGFEG